MEQWRSIPGWEGFYEASDLGRVRSVTRTVVIPNPWGEMAPRTYRGRVLRAGISKNGYPLVSFTGPDRKREYRYVHDLVLLAFVGPKVAPLEVCHDDGVRSNCRLDNLRYDTRSANSLDRRRHGTVNPTKGEDMHCAVLTDDAVRRIRRWRPVVTLQELADMYGVSTSTISMAEHRKTWKHVA